MLDKIKQAMRMWKAGNTHGEIKEVTGLTHEQEYTSTEIAKQLNLSPQDILGKIDKIKEGMKSEEIEELFK